MKLLIWSLIIVGLYFLYQYTLGDIFREYERCYEVAQYDIAADGSINSPTSQCVNRKLAYDNMSQCFMELQKENTLAGMLYDASSVAKPIKEEIAAHNEECKGHQLTEPKMSIYLNSSSN